MHGAVEKHTLETELPPQKTHLVQVQRRLNHKSSQKTGMVQVQHRLNHNAHFLLSICPSEFGRQWKKTHATDKVCKQWLYPKTRKQWLQVNTSQQRQLMKEFASKRPTTTLITTTTTNDNNTNNNNSDSNGTNNNMVGISLEVNNFLNRPNGCSVRPHF